MPHPAIPVFLVLSALAGLVSGQESHPRSPDHASPPTASTYSKALKLLRIGQLSEALAETDAGLSRTPGDPSLHNLRGLISSRMGRYQEAQDSFRRVIELRPRQAMGYVNLGTLFSHLGRHEEATGLFHSALEQEPRDPSALLGLGASLAVLHRYVEAEPYLKRAWSAQRGDFQAGYEWARVLRELRRHDEAQKVLERITPPREAPLAAKYFTLFAVVAKDRGRLASAVHLYRRAYELSPAFDIYLALVRAILAQGELGASMKLPPEPSPLSSEQHFELGVLLASRNAFAEAIPHFEETLRQEPSSYSATYDLALSYKVAGRNPSAIELIRGAVERWPTGELYNLLASAEEAAGDYVKAVEDYRRAVESDPGNEEYYFDLGAEYLTHFTFGPALEVFYLGGRKFPAVARQQVGLGLARYALRQYSQAADAFLSALEIDASSPSAFAAWNSLPPLLAPAETQRILPRLERLAGTHPNSPEALYCYAVSVFRNALAAAYLKHLDEAQSLLERVIRLKPDFAEAHLELGNLYAARRQYERAAVEFQQAIRLKADSEMGHYLLGQTYRNLGQLERARQELARYTELVHKRQERMASTRSAIRQFILAETQMPRRLMPDDKYR